MVKYLELGELSSNLEFMAAVEVQMALVQTMRLTRVSAASLGKNLEFNS